VGTSKSKPLYLLFLLLIIYLQFFHRLGTLGLVGPDEPRYAAVAREMLVSGDYVTPRLSGQVWFEKPILYYWLTALFYRLFGVSELAARLASALAGTLGVVVVFLIGREWINVRGGLIAASILSTSVLYFSLARAASTDMLFTGTLSVSWACSYLVLFGNRGEKPGETCRSKKTARALLFSGGAGENTGHFPSEELERGCSDLSAFSRLKSKPLTRPSWGIFTGSSVYLSYIFLALSVLSKGPVGLVLWGGVLTIFLLVTRQLEILKKMKLGSGTLIFLVVALPWYWLCYQANGYRFIGEFLMRHNLERFTTTRFQHTQPFWFYFAVLFAGFFPWIFQVISPARRFFKKRLRISSKAEAKELYIWLWVLVPLLFFSLSRSKLPGYILPVAPSMALLIASEFELFLTDNPDGRGKKWFSWAAFFQALCVCLLGAVLPIIKDRLNIEIGPFVPQMERLLIGVGSLGMIFVCWRRVLQLLACYLIGTGLMVILIIHQIIPQIDHIESARKLAAVLKQEGFVDQTILILGLPRRIEYGLNFYLNTTTKIIYSENELSSGEKEIFLIAPHSFESKSLLLHFVVKSETVFNNQKIMKVIPLPHYTTAKEPSRVRPQPQPLKRPAEASMQMEAGDFSLEVQSCRDREGLVSKWQTARTLWRSRARLSRDT